MDAIVGRAQRRVYALEPGTPPVPPDMLVAIAKIPKPEGYRTAIVETAIQALAITPQEIGPRDSRSVADSALGL